MATLTSLYLCNRMVYAAVGTPTARGAKVSITVEDELPEGCLINGVITNEADLAAALRGFFSANALPTKHVALAVGGSQFQTRLLQIPAMKEKNRMAVVTQELNALGAENTAPLDDYMLLAQDSKAHTDTLLAARVEGAVIGGYVALAQAAGLTLSCIDHGLAGQIKLVRSVPSLAGKTFVVLQFDGDTIVCGLYEDGQYNYATRSRLFHKRGTPESGAEIAQKLSGLVQFHSANKATGTLDCVYFGGGTAEDLEACRPGCEAISLRAQTFPDSPAVRLPNGMPLAAAMFAVGNLVGR